MDYKVHAIRYALGIQTTDLKKEWIELLSLKVKPIMAAGPSAGLVALVDVQPAWASITVISAVEMIFLSHFVD